MILRRALVAVGLLLVVLWCTAVPAGAHAELEESRPAGGATIADPPSVVRLQFSESMESTFGGVQVFDPSGSRVLERGPASVTGGTIDLPIELIEAPGTYAVAYRVLSADGHPVESRFSFIYDPQRGPAGALRSAPRARWGPP